MIKYDTCEPAFPRTYSHDGHNGMSLRDWFAGQALIVVARLWADDPGFKPEEYAEDAYQIADAMLAARAKGGNADG